MKTYPITIDMNDLTTFQKRQFANLIAEILECHQMDKLEGAKYKRLYHMRKQLQDYKRDPDSPKL